MRHLPNCLKTGIMHTLDNKNHNLSDIHNWALLRKIIIKLCVLSTGQLSIKRNTIPHSHSASCSLWLTCPPFHSPKKMSEQKRAGALVGSFHTCCPEHEQTQLFSHTPHQSNPRRMEPISCSGIEGCPLCAFLSHYL